MPTSEIIVATSTIPVEQLVGHAFEAGSKGSWAVAIGAGLMVVTKLATKMGLLKMVPPEGKKWVVLGVSVAGALGTGLYFGSSFVTIASAALTTAFAAVGAWEFTKPKADAEDD